MIQRGFTLLEVMVSAGIASVVAFGVFALITGQVEGYNREERVTNAQMVVRASMMEVVKDVSQAGFGIPGDWAIGPGSANNVVSGVLGTCPNTDVLEVRARDPRGYWPLAAGSTSSNLNFSLSAPMTTNGTDFDWPLGSRVFAYSALGHYSLARISAKRLANTTGAALIVAESGDLDLPGNADVRTTSQVYLVNTYRFRVICTEPEHPTLVLERDTDRNNDGIVDVNDQLPVATDIEDMQVAYLMDPDRDGIVTDANAVAHPSLAVDPNYVVAADRLRAVKAVRVTLVSWAKSQLNPTNLPLIVEDHSPPQVPDAHVRRLLRQVITFENRDTASPDTYLHMSNQVL